MWRDRKVVLPASIRKTVQSSLCCSNPAFSFFFKKCLTTFLVTWSPWQYLLKTLYCLQKQQLGKNILRYPRDKQTRRLSLPRWYLNWVVKKKICRESMSLRALWIQYSKVVEKSSSVCIHLLLCSLEWSNSVFL